MEPQITITIPSWKHKRLLERIETLKVAVRLFRIHEEFKKAYIDDIHAVEQIIKHGGNGHEQKHNSIPAHGGSRS